MSRLSNARSLQYAGIVLGVVCVPSIFILIAARDPLAAWSAFFGYALGTSIGFSEVVVHAIPLTLIGAGVAIAFRAGLYNIGGDGQLICGAVLAVALAKELSALGALGLPVFMLMGFIGGGLVGALVGWLRERFNANEIIVTILFNYIALQLLTWVNRGPLQDPMRIFPRSYLIPDNLFLSVVWDGTRVHTGLWIALAAAGLLFVLMTRTAFGFKAAVVGTNPEAASYAGIDRRATVIATLFFSGALAGLAGAVEIAGLHHRLEDGFSEGFGLSAIAVALLARLNALLVPFAAMLFGVFYVGAGALQRQADIPFPLIWIIEAAVIFGFLALGAVRHRSLQRGLA